MSDYDVFAKVANNPEAHMRRSFAEIIAILEHEIEDSCGGQVSLGKLIEAIEIAEQHVER